jgi:ABC-2 type transport system ATP-binding protein
MIVARDISHSFSSKKIIEKLSFNLDNGEIIWIRGGNGSGKTTLLKIVAGLLSPDSGSIEVNGLLFRSNKPEINKLVGHYFDDSILIEKFTINEYLTFVGGLFQINRNELKNRIAFWTDFFELTNSKIWIEDYSKGMKKKAGLIAGLIKKSDYVILDEPFANLDELMQSKFHSYLLDSSQKGKSYLIATHLNDALLEKYGVILNI